MSDDVSSQIDEALFEAALGIGNSEARREFLVVACTGNPDRLSRVTSWLEAQASADKFFHTATIARAEVSSEVAASMEGEASLVRHHATVEDTVEDTGAQGSRIGRYHLLKRIGEGGHGVVYLAEQLEPVRRRVALKVIRSGLDSTEVMARFETERQALALMDHPGIARVFDAGSTDDGRPYFVMELVTGERITSYCDAQRLGVRERLELFIQVCQAIQHAHQKGIIHRDIKPSNVLVSCLDGSPVPKVIDFGIARAVEGKLGDQTYVTSLGQVVGTPAYMSPEQAEGGQAPDTRGDVYSLGVLLYELLGGAPPFDGKLLTQIGLFEMLRILREEEPLVPSEMLRRLEPDRLADIAAARNSTPSALIGAVRGDLDWIVAKAMAKDRRGRYHTVNGLGVDVRRFLDDEAVAARPPGTIYLFRKLLRRHKLVFATAAGITVALVAGLAIASWFYLSEREARQVQASLRDAAEAARANEARLLVQSKARESVSQAAMLLADGKIEEADALLLETPPASIEPSMEAAQVLVTLAEWNGIRQRWRQAADCYLLYLQANRIGHRSKPEAEVLHLTALAVSLVEAGDADQYHRLCDEAIARHGHTTNADERYNLLKACLLLPADKELLARLQPHVDAWLQALARRPYSPPANAHPGFAELSLAMFAWRSGDFAGTREWSRQCLACPVVNVSRAAAAHALAAMAEHKLGQPDEARLQLENAREILNGPYDRDVPFPRGQANGRWFNWGVARILEREATTVLAGSDR